MITGLEGLATPQYELPPGFYTQRQGETRDYTIDWTQPGKLYEWVLPEGDTIVSSVWAADTGLAIAATAPTFTDTTTTLWVAGSPPWFLYRAHNTITSAAGRIAERVLRFKIVE